MEDFRPLYLILSRAVAKALKELEYDRSVCAADLLIHAQEQAEALYCKQTDSGDIR